MSKPDKRSRTENGRRAKNNKAKVQSNMPCVQPIPKVIALLCSDLHLSSLPPIWRTPELDWGSVIYNLLWGLGELKNEYDCPILYAGDMFDRWNSKPDIINCALAWMPDKIYAIPGQHDLPDHSFQEINRSAFWALVLAKKIILLSPSKPIQFDTFTLYGFPYGFEIKPPRLKDKNKITVAICHEYNWVPGKVYGGSELPDGRVSKKRKKEYKGYDVVIYGDNHQNFKVKVGNTLVYNCGCMMRRSANEIDYKPAVGLLFSDGTIKRHYLDISKDKYLEGANTADIKTELDMNKIIEELNSLAGDTGLDFVELVKFYIRQHKVKGRTKKIILEAVGIL